MTAKKAAKKAEKRTMEQRVADALKAAKKPLTAAEIFKAMSKGDPDAKSGAVRRLLIRMWTDKKLVRDQSSLAASTFALVKASSQP